ncbi:patatin-like phospholipase family protein [Bacillus cereus]
MKEENIKMLGLALSGGGFRASFYHIGVLARLADLGLLRSVGIISTVSGGSINGALYYLHLKKLLEEKRDVEIKDEDYQKIVAKIEVDFLKVIQKHLRLRIFLNPIKNIKMILPNYSRNDHIGELYDKFLYRKVLDTNNSIFDNRVCKLLTVSPGLPRFKNVILGYFRFNMFTKETPERPSVKLSPINPICIFISPFFYGS